MTRRPVRKAFLCTAALHAAALLGVVVSAAAQPAPNARPMGGQVVAGAATISQAPNATNIAQSSNRAAINWNSFDVGGGQAVNFAQPSAASVTLNRVTGPDPSQIAGKINANGQVVITNGSGVYFHAGSQVNAQSLVVSAAGISDANFMSGRMVFDGAPNANARIDNRGTITVKQAGLAALVAPSVGNSGVINAKLGQVVLAGARTHTLDMYGDGLVAIDVTGQVRETPRGPDGAPVTALVTNTGLIRADGGVVQLTAAAADGVVSTLVRSGGRVQANTVNGRTGRIEITGTGGAVVVEGRVAADGRAPGDAGGQVLALADRITGVANGAHISANGRAGGGTVAIGTTLARARSTGAAAQITSRRVIVGEGALVSADGTGAGSGGRVTVLSTDDTRIGGTLTARGGAHGGDGGTVEMSGAHGFALTGTASAAAPHGRMGDILLDPYDLQIVGNTGTSSVTLLNGVDPNLAFSTNGSTYPTDTVTAGAIQALTGFIHLQTVHDLTVSAPLTLGNQQSLSLEAGNNLNILPGATITSSGFGTIMLTAGSNAIPGFNPGGAISLLGDIAAPNAQLVLNAGTGGIAFGSNVNVRFINIQTTGAVSQSAGGITSGDLSGNAASVSFTSRSNAISNIGQLTEIGFGFATTGATGDFILVDSAPLTVGSGNASGISVRSSRTIALVTDSFSLTPNSNAPSQPILVAPNGTVAFAPYTPGRALQVVGPGAHLTAPDSPILIGTDQLRLVSASTLQLGAAPSASPTASAIILGDAATAVDLTGVVGTLNLQAIGAVTQIGSLTVGTVGGQAGSVDLSNPGNAIGAIGTFTSAGSFAVANNISANIAGAVTVGAGQAITINSSPSFGPSGSLNAPNGIVSLQVAGDYVVCCNTPTSGTASPIVASTYRVTSLGGGTLAFIGDLNLSGVGTLDLRTTGAITQSGVLTVPTLTGRAGSAALTGSNQIGTLNNFDVGAGSLALSNSTPLTITGAIRASQLAVSATQVTLANAAILTDAFGVSVQGGPQVRLAASTNTGGTGANGGGLLLQTGTTTIAPLTGSRVAVVLSADNGAVSLDNLVAPQADVTLALGAGTARGNLQVGSLMVNGSGGSATLFGTVAGQGGQPAARLSQIQPRTDANYTLNSCVIGAPACTFATSPIIPTLPVVTAPIVLPLFFTDGGTTQLVDTLSSPATFLVPKFPPIYIPEISTSRDKDDPLLLLPNISDRDY